MSDAYEIALAESPGSRISEFVIRTYATPSGTSALEFIIRLRGGYVLSERLESRDRSFTVSDVHGLVHSLSSAVMSHLTLSGGVQLSLDD